MKLEVTNNQSTCIANLGVVPLFLLAIFLFLPAFFLLLILLRFKTLVFDTIYLLLKTNIQLDTHLRSFNYLPATGPLVKIFVIILSITLTCHHNCLKANEISTSYNSVILSKGEHKEIGISRISKFSVTNQEVISYKHIPKKNKILIKGQKLGYSELIIWSKDKKKLVNRIYVLGKMSQFKIVHLAKILKLAGLSTSLEGTTVIATGEIDQYFYYDLVWKLIKKNPDKINVKVTLSKKLRNEIIGEVYYYLFNEYKDEIICENSFIEINCRYNKLSPPDSNIINFLKKKYHVKFLGTYQVSNQENYKIKVKLIQTEYQSDFNISFGLNELNGSISEVFKSGLKGLIEKNKILLNENELTLSTLAEPEIIIKPKNPAKIEVGSEIPFGEQKNNDSAIVHTNWKFAGLKVILTLLKDGPSFELDYKTEFTRPGKNNQISGSKEHSKAQIKLNTPTILFQIGFKAFGKNTGKLPILSSIPILGNLFENKSDRTIYKKITALVVITKNEI